MESPAEYLREDHASSKEGRTGNVLEVGELRSTEVAREIPDGGVAAWLQVAGGFAIFFNTW